MPSLPGLTSPLSDGVVSLRPSAERDIPEVLIAYQDDHGLAAALGEQRPPTGAALGSRAENALAELRAGRALTLTIVERDSDICGGEVRITGVDWEARRATVTVWLAPDLRGRGLARRAHALALDWLRAESGLDGACRAAEGS
jgi:RimJ/RimL family protein N-acetyltransferase